MKKGTIKEDHIPRNKGTLFVPGYPPFAFTSITGMEEELQTVDLPDKTRASGGHTTPVEITCRHPMHHKVHESLLEDWYQEGKDPITPGHKKVASLQYKSGTGNITRTYPMIGMFPNRRKPADIEADNEGELAETEWRFSVDDVLRPG